MSEWREYRLDEIGQVVGGGTPSSKVNAYWNGNVGWVTPADLSGYQFKHIGNGSRDITELGLKKSSAKLHPKNTVLMTSRAPIGYLAIADKPVATNQGFQSIRCNEDIADFNFIYYLLGAYKEGIALIASGATFPEVSGGKVRQYKIKLPPLPTQQKIAKILSNYDDLIENNLKRIKLLEESARLTYEEWFLRFRIDGKKLDIDPETRLPFGWSKVRLDDIFEFSNGYAFYTKGYSDVGYDVIDLGNISTSSDLQITGNEKKISDKLYKKHTKFHLNKYDVVVAMTDMTKELGILAKTAIIDENNKYILNQRVGRIRSKIDHVNHSFLYAVLNDPRFIGTMHSMSKGAVQFYFNTKDIISYEIYLPTIKQIEQFQHIHTKLLEQRVILKNQNQHLKEARDILLPRLMTGMIDTDDMDVAV